MVRQGISYRREQEEIRSVQSIATDYLILNFFFLLGSISGCEFLKPESNATLALLVWSEFMLRAHSNNASVGLKGHESTVDHLSYKVVHRGLLMPRWPRLPQGDQGRPWKCQWIIMTRYWGSILKTGIHKCMCSNLGDFSKIWNGLLSEYPKAYAGHYLRHSNISLNIQQYWWKLF